MLAKYILIAANIGKWPTNRWGYFISSKIDKVEIVKAFAEELSKIPPQRLLFIEQAKK